MGKLRHRRTKCSKEEVGSLPFQEPQSISSGNIRTADSTHILVLELGDKVWVKCGPHPARMGICLLLLYCDTPETGPLWLRIVGLIKEQGVCGGRGFQTLTQMATPDAVGQFIHEASVSSP